MRSCITAIETSHDIGKIVAIILSDAYLLSSLSSSIMKVPRLHLEFLPSSHPLRTVISLFITIAIKLHVTCNMHMAHIN